MYLPKPKAASALHIVSCRIADICYLDFLASNPTKLAAAMSEAEMHIHSISRFRITSLPATPG